MEYDSNIDTNYGWRLWNSHKGLESGLEELEHGERAETIQSSWDRQEYWEDSWRLESSFPSLQEKNKQMNEMNKNLENIHIYIYVYILSETLPTRKWIFIKIIWKFTNSEMDIHKIEINL